MIQRRIRMSEAVHRAIDVLHPDVKRKVRAALDEIRKDPAAGLPLQGELTGFRKVVLGTWRIVYRVERRAAGIYAVGRRSTVYTEAIDRAQRRIEEARRGRRRASRS